LRRSTLKTRNRAGQALRLAAPAVSRSHHSVGAFSRRMRAREREIARLRNKAAKLGLTRGESPA
jgi:hypothetical protein